ncbi:MAG: hypothetical protein H7Y86_10030, partial [Rhizobacter sp.]|nr:hypothetical protein [Ferruginibacter sp.]
LAMIDTSGILQRLLLTRKSSTSSVILMPGRQFICFTAAAGWEALSLTGSQVKQLLAADLAKMD